MRKIYLFLVACALTLSSCDFSTPALYEEEITDYVKFELALIDYIEDEVTSNAQAASWLLGEELASLALVAASEEISQMESYFVDRWGDAESFEQLFNEELENEDNPYYEEAQKLLEYYRSQVIVLSDFEELTDWDAMVEVWSFSEVRSGLEFVFSYDVDADTFYIEPEDDSLDELIEDLFD